ncbi:MAG: DivIVA domain-containing protein [Acidobacteria bacterium]|nr:DivIVA domain-containing protein [Acidobacteriota bacterium]
MNDSSQFSSSIDKATFSVARRGYAKKEVRAFLDEVEVAFTDLERHAHDASARIRDLERQLESMKAAESKTMDNALYSVFDAKDRILDKARRRAEKVESQAQERAAELVQEAEKNLAASRAGRGTVGGETSAEVIADAHAEAARIREDAARFAATVSDGDVETIAGELAKSRADLIAERARADKAEETAHRKGQELNDLLRDASEAGSVEDLSEARSHGATIVSQAQEEAESILQRARDEAKTVRELARKQGDRTTAVAAMRDLAYDTDPAAALVAARSKIETLEAKLAAAPGPDDADATEDHLRAGVEERSAAVLATEERNADLEGHLAAALADSESLEAVRAELVEALDSAGKLNAAETEIVELTAALDDLRTEVTAMSEAVDLANGRATEAVTDRDKAGHAAAELDERDALATQRIELEENAAKLVEENERAASAVAAAGEREAALADLLKQSEQTQAVLTESLEKAASEHDQVVAALDSHILDMKAAVADVQGERDAFAQANTALEAKVGQLQDRTHDPTPAADTVVSEMLITSETREDVPDSPVDAATDELVAKPFVRGRSRYERNSAKLPRIGDQGESVLESMRNLRASMTDK